MMTNLPNTKAEHWNSDQGKKSKKPKCRQKKKKKKATIVLTWLLCSFEWLRKPKEKWKRNKMKMKELRKPSFLDKVKTNASERGEKLAV